jgi:hypothetical protein
MRQLGIVTFFLVAGFYVFAMFTGPAGWPAMMKKRGELVEVEQQNDRLKYQIEKERDGIKALQESGPARDRVIREKTRKQKRSETTIYFGEPGSQPAQ